MPPRLTTSLVALALVLAACGPRQEPPARSSSAAPSAPESPSPPPSPPPRFTFAVKGDWGAGTPEQAAVTGAMCELRKTRPFDVVVTTGDNFYRPDGRATQANYYGPEACLIDHPGHQWRATWGNHDAGRPSTAEVLGAVERTYTWTSGPAQFFMLDSNRVTEAGQTDWLATQLAASQNPVKIVVFHHPPFAAGLHESSLPVRERWVPLFEQFGVDLVLNGHNHGYEHSVVNGVDYVVTGGGGAQLYPCASDPVYLQTCVSINHFLLLEVEGENVSVTAVGTDGRPVDRFELAGAA